MRASSRRRWPSYLVLSLCLAFTLAMAGSANREAAESSRQAAEFEADTGHSVSLPGARFVIASGRASNVRLLGSLASPDGEGERVEVGLSQYRAERTPGDLRILLTYGAEGDVLRLDVQAFETGPERAQWSAFTVPSPGGGVCDLSGTTCVSAHLEDAGLVELQALLPAGRCFTTVRVAGAGPAGAAEPRAEGELLTCGLPAVFTDRAHYAVGTAVPISGRGFAPFEIYQLSVVRTAPVDILDARTADTWSSPVVADGLGRLSALHTLDSTEGTYEVRVHAYRTDAPTEIHPEPLAHTVFLGDLCGNGTLDGSEECDDNNEDNGDGCDSNCIGEICGNGVLQVGEECDDGGTGEGDGCDEDCIIETCGNGITQSGEDCDDVGESSTCDEDCTSAECGDSDLNEAAGEECDDGFESSTCDDDCTLAECGDFYTNVSASEECDGGGETPDCDDDCTFVQCLDSNHNATAGEYCDDGVETSSCDEDCTEVECGDFNINEPAFEDCDDGGETFSCDDDCTFVFCGDSNVNEAADEDCDDDGESAVCDDDCTSVECGDSNVNGTAGEDCDEGGESLFCDDDCTDVQCGDSNVNEEAFENCDDGGVNTSSCDEDCTYPDCGDGLLNTEAGEQCDDGSFDNGDGCDSNCQSETCGNGIVQSGEECDDSNTDDGDGCDSSCIVETCGNGIQQFNEECDDGNLNSNDNCVDCQDAFCGDGWIEGAGTKAVAGGDECDDGDTDGGDGCSASCTIEPGYDCSGEPSTCTDLNECALDTDNCDANASCTNNEGSFVCTCDVGYEGDGVTCTAIACPNLLQNGDFSGGTSNWSKFFNTAGATFTVAGGVAQVSIVTQTSNGQIYQTPLTLQPNTEYKVSFRGKNSKGDNVTVQVIKNVSPFTKYGSRVFDLTDVFQEFSFEFTSPAVIVPDGRLMLHVSPHDSNNTLYEFDDVRFELASCSPPDCGNGTVDSGEECDDSNTTNDDGCSSTCLLETCGDGIINGAEECDDGSLNGINGLCSATCTTEPPSGCPNLVQNGDFSSGTSSWSKFFNTAGATFSVVGGVAQANIVTQTSNGQVYQTPIALQPNTEYRVTLSVRNTKGDDLTVKVIKNVASFTVYGADTFDLTDAFQDFSFLFTSPAAPVPNGRLMLHFSPHDTNGTSYEFDNVVLEQVSCAP